MTVRDTFPKLLCQNAIDFADHPSVREKDLGIWQTWSWSQAQAQVEEFALGLASRGFERGEKLCLVGSNRPRLYWALSAAQALGGIPVPTYQDSVAEEIRYVIEHSDARYVVAEDQEQVDKILDIQAQGVRIDLIVFDNARGLRDYDHTAVVSFDQIQREGIAYKNSYPNFFEQSVAKGSGDDEAVMLYTSGTTGKPKGVVLTYDNLIFCADAISTLESLNTSDSIMAYLPMAWIVDHFFSYAMHHVCGYCICCPESQVTALADKSEIGPSFHFTSPRVLETHRTSLMTRMEDAASIKQKMFSYFIGVAARVGIDLIDGKSVPLMDRVLYGIGKVLVYEPLKNVLGYTKTRVTYTAGEAIGPDMFRFYRSLGINLKQVYGQTEASPFVTVQTDDCVRSDTVGVEIPGVEIRITDEGEVTFRGRGAFKVYHKNPQATAETKDEQGWVHTGDAGFFDHEGQLKIIDRVKDVGQMADGSMFAPKHIENKLKFSPFILEAVAIGDGREACVAMINIDLEAVGNWAERRNIPYASYQELAAHMQVHDLIRADIEAVNSDLSEDRNLASSQVTKFLILHKELDADDGELTRTRKIRRSIVAEKYHVLVEALYSNEPQCFVETQVRFEDGKVGKLSATVEISPVKVFVAVSSAAA